MQNVHSKFVQPMKSLRGPPINVEPAVWHEIFAGTNVPEFGFRT